MSAEAVGVDPRQEPSLLRWRIAVLEPKVKRSQAIFVQRPSIEMAMNFGLEPESNANMRSIVCQYFSCKLSLCRMRCSHAFWYICSQCTEIMILYR